jgi:hypothetical protein
VHPAAIASFLSHLGMSPGRVRLVCERLTGRRLLRRCLPHDMCPPMFGSVADAVGDLVDGDEPDALVADTSTSVRAVLDPPQDVAVRRSRLHHQDQLHSVN